MYAKNYLMRRVLNYWSRSVETPYHQINQQHLRRRHKTNSSSKPSILGPSTGMAKGDFSSVYVTMALSIGVIFFAGRHVTFTDYM